MGHMQAIKRISSRARRLSSLKPDGRSVRRFGGKSSVSAYRSSRYPSNSFSPLNRISNIRFSSAIPRRCPRMALLSHPAVSDAAVRDVEFTLNSEHDKSTESIIHSVAFVTASFSLNRAEKEQLVAELLDSCREQAVVSPSRIFVVDVIPVAKCNGAPSSRQCALASF